MAVIYEYSEYQCTSMSSLENTTGYTRGAMTQYAPGHSESQCNQWSPWDAVQHYSSAVRHYLHYSLVTPVQLQCISFQAALYLAAPSATLLETSWQPTFIASIQWLLATCSILILSNPLHTRV